MSFKPVYKMFLFSERQVFADAPCIKGKTLTGIMCQFAIISVIGSDCENGISLSVHCPFLYFVFPHLFLT